MTWATEIDKPSTKVKTVIYLYPKYIISSGWTLHSGSIWYKQLDFGAPTNVWQGSPQDTAAITPDYQDDAVKFEDVGTLASIVSSGEFAYDSATSRLYVKVITHPLGTSANDAHFIIEYKRTTASEAGYYSGEYIDGTLIRSPVFKQGFADQLYGFLPVEQSTIVISNADNAFTKYLYDSIWKNVDFDMYQYFNDESRIVMSGLVNDISIGAQEISLSVKSYLDFLDKSYDLKTFKETGLTGTRSADSGYYVRKIYGRVNGFVPVGIAYTSTISTSANRSFVVSKDFVSAHPVLSSLIDTGFANTTTTRKVASAAGFERGDSIAIKVSGTYQYAKVVSVNYSTNVITHTAIGSSSSASGDDVKRGFIGAIVINNNGSIYNLEYSRDWTEVNHHATGCAGFLLTTNFEANFGAPVFDPDNMTISCIVHGIKTTEAFESTNVLGAASNRGGSYANPIGVLLSVIKEAGDVLSLIDETSFTAEYAAEDDYVGFAIPSEAGGLLPKYRDVVVNLLNSFLGRIYLGDTASGPKFMVNRIAPAASTADYELGVDELSNPNFDFNFEDQPSRLDVKFANQEVFIGDRSLASSVEPPETIYSDTFAYIFKNGNQARWAYNTRFYLQFDTYLDLDYTQESADQIETFANRLQALICERRCTLTVNVKNRFFSANIGDTIEVNRESLPGFDYVFGTERSRKFILVEKNQSINGFTIVLDDQKGVEDFAGSW